MEKYEDAQGLSLEEKSAIVQSWFDKYEIVKIVIKRPDVVIYLRD